VAFIAAASFFIDCRAQTAHESMSREDGKPEHFCERDSAVLVPGVAAGMVACILFASAISVRALLRARFTRSFSCGDRLNRLDMPCSLIFNRRLV
jgi:hypothetical protein